MAIARRCIWLVVFALGVVAALPFPDTVTDTAVADWAGARVVDDIRVFDVTKYGARGDGKPVYDEDGESINGLYVMKAWGDACANTEGRSKLLIPKGRFVVAQTSFTGPCKSHVTIELLGTIEPDPDDSQFPNHILLEFDYVSNVTLTGPGKIDAKNRGPPKSYDSDREIEFFELMPLIRIYNATNIVVDGIKCENPSAFDILVVLSRNISIQNVKFDADYSLAPESDTSGVYISASSQVTVSNSSIRTGDHCITIAPGSSEVFVTGVTCLVGQGISIGRDGYDIESDQDVKNVTVRNCTFEETTVGASLFPRTEANRHEVSNITFENLVMKKVKNPIVIYQEMHPRPEKGQSVQATVRNVNVRNITGTMTSRNAVTILCDPKLPCENIRVADVNLKYIGKSLLGKASGRSDLCSNADVLYDGNRVNRHSNHLRCHPLH